MAKKSTNPSQNSFLRKPIFRCHQTMLFLHSLAGAAQRLLPHEFNYSLPYASIESAVSTSRLTDSHCLTPHKRTCKALPIVVPNLHSPAPSLRRWYPTPGSVLRRKAHPSDIARSAGYRNSYPQCQYSAWPPGTVPSAGIAQSAPP